MEGDSTGGVTFWVWLIFGAAVTVMLAIDFRAYRGDHAASRRVTLIWSIIWILAGLLFGGVVWVRFGGDLAQEYYAAYAMEKGLSLDNMFLFYVIFRSLGVPRRYQHEVLFLGILGALFFRGLFIFVGAAAVERWNWVTYVFAGILLFAAWRAWRENPAATEKSRVVEWLARRLPVTKKVESRSLFVRSCRRGVVATPLLLGLIAIELTDIMFAIDSVPAALSITRDRFVVYSSNIFAILGLRALYLFLAATIMRLRYLHYGLAAVLAFAAAKMVTDEWLHIPPLVAIAIIAALIGGAIAASLRPRRAQARAGVT